MWPNISRVRPWRSYPNLLVSILLLTSGLLQKIHSAEPKSAAFSNNNQSPPKIVLQGSELRHVASAGTTVQLSCGASGADFFDWSKEGDPLLETERIRVTSQGAIKIKSVSSEDTGHYVCRAVNGFGSVTVSVSLLVLESEDTDDKEERVDEVESQQTDTDNPNHGNLFPGRNDDEPVMSAKPSDTPQRSKPEFTHVTKFPHPVIQRPVSSTVRLKCEGKGNPRPQLTWLRDGHPVMTAGSTYRGAKPLSTSYHLPSGAKLGRWTLTMHDLKPQDAGNYTCLLHNVMGSKNITFNIEVVDRIKKKPELTGDHPINTTVNTGATATLQCRVKSDVPPHIQWLKRVEKGDLIDFAESISSRGAISSGVEENLIVVEGESFRVLRSSDILENPEGTFLNKLIINDVTESDSGKYVCLGANTLGYNFRSAYLTVVNHQKHRSDHDNSTSLTFSSVPFPITVAVSVLGIAIMICIIASVRRYGLRQPKEQRRRPDGVGEDCKSLQQKREIPVTHHHLRNVGGMGMYPSLEQQPCGLDDVTVHKLLPKRTDRDSMRPPLGIECNSSIRTNRSSGNSSGSCHNAKYYPSRL